MDDYAWGHSVGFSNGWDKALERFFYILDNIPDTYDAYVVSNYIEEKLKEMRK